MRYQGGKARLSPRIVRVLQGLRKPGQVYLEPFVGGGEVLAHMGGARIASDINPHLIAMYRALQIGWVPPHSVTEQEYNAQRDKYNKNQDVVDPLNAFIGFGCSWGAKFWGGYARDGQGRDYPEQTARSLERDAPLWQDVAFTCVPYWHWMGIEGVLVYSDPPYEGTLGYRGTDDFDHQLFWLNMQELARKNTVVVSERCEVPSEVAEVIWEMEYKGGIRGNIVKPPERLFLVKPLKEEQCQEIVVQEIPNPRCAPVPPTGIPPKLYKLPTLPYGI